MTPDRAVLGIGTATFLANYGINPGPRPGDDLLRAALDGGVRYVDTAADYGDGERALGRVLRDGIRVCTKIPAAGTLDAVRASVERLGRPPDTILMHSAGREQIATGAAVRALTEAKREGLTGRIGVSTYGTDDAAFALAQPWCDAVQVEYSILNQSVIRGVERTRPGQEIVVRSVLCKGLLTSRRAAAPHLLAGVADALESLDAKAREWGRTVEELAIRFALDTPGIDVVLVGISSREELETALAADGSPRLTTEEWQALAALDRSDADAAHPERWK